MKDVYIQKEEPELMLKDKKRMNQILRKNEAVFYLTWSDADLSELKLQIGRNVSKKGNKAIQSFDNYWYYSYYDSKE